MKILAAIANYGTKNMHYLDILIEEYRSMKYDVNIVVLSNIPKNLGSDIEVLVGLPDKNPWSLPFAHKKAFAERSKDYDLYIYSEDDTLLTEKNIDAFLKVTSILDENEIAGFIRYEIDSSGRKYYSTIHSHFHWKPDSVKSVGEYTFAHFTNDHSACYILTQKQLNMAIKSGGYLVKPHDEKYDLLVTAATDPYTQCGLTKMICVSHIKDFQIHHLPDQYLGKMGIDEHELHIQLNVLLANKQGEELFQAQTKIKQSRWSKNYYERPRLDILDLIPKNVKNVLSVGCGWGATEAELVKRGIRVVGIPIDEIIGACAKERGVEIVTPNFEIALQQLVNKSFDAIIFSDILQYLQNPPDILTKFSKLIAERGIILIRVPNFNRVNILRDLLFKKYNISINDKINFDKTNLHFTTKKMVKNWLNQSKIEITNLFYDFEERFEKYSKFSHGFLNELLASNILITGRKR